MKQHPVIKQVLLHRSRLPLWVLPLVIVGAGAVTLPSPSAGAPRIRSAAGAQQAVQPPGRFQTNLLGNGGFEVWSLGATPLGPTPPDLWYPMGDTTDLFTQASVRFDRVQGTCGDHAVAIWPAVFSNFVSQTLENGAEFCGKTITFSVDLEADPDCGPTMSEIQISDGLSSSSATLLVQPGDPVRLSVSHAVAGSEVEVRIYPRGICVIADNAQASLGQLADASYVPRANPEPATPNVPLGTVIDWWRPNASVAIPDRFTICYGGVVSDPSSPFSGLATPNLANKFIRAVTSAGDIGSQGGAETVELSHTHDMNHVHRGTTSQASEVAQVANQPFVGYHTPQHTHDFTTGLPIDPGNGSVRTSTGPALGPISVLPPYVGLLKLVRTR